MASHLALFGLEVVTVAALLLIGGRIVAAYPRQPPSWLALLLCISVVAHVSLSRVEYGPWTPEAYRLGFAGAEPALDVLRNMAPALFALLAHATFTDRRRPPNWLWALVMLQLALEAAAQLLGPRLAFDAVSALMHLAFSGLAVFWTLAYWRADLIEERRRTRALLAILLAVHGVAASILLRLVVPQEAYASFQIHVGLTAITGAIAVFLVVRLMSGEIAPYLDRDPRRRRSAVEGRAREDDQALARLERLISVENIHFEPGLSLARLGARLGTPEYRLRRLIHERLGFRNFNAFLHAHRIRSAAQQLADPSQRRTPILTIALSCGYESINTFNRGFREVTGLTPSAYRARQLSSSDPAAASPDSA